MLLQMTGLPSFLRVNNILLCVCMCVHAGITFFIRSSADAPLGRFRASASVIHAAVNVAMQLSLQEPGVITFGHALRRGIAES